MIRAHHTPQGIFDSACDLLEDWTARSSRSGDVDGLERAAAGLAEALAERNLHVRIRRCPDLDGVHLPIVEAAVRSATLEPTTPGVLAIGHLDTVLPAVVPTRDGDRFVATGSVDMKAGLVAFVAALDLLAHRGLDPPGDLVLVVVPDEEVTGVLSHRAVAERASSLRELWVLEPGSPAGNGETVVAGRRGMLHWHLEATGRGGHAGNAYWDGRSALLAASRFALGAAALSLPDAGPTVNPARLVAADADYASAPERQPGLLGTSRQTNLVPNRARLDGEARFLRSAEGAALELALRALARRTAGSSEVELDLRISERIPPFDPDGPGRSRLERASAIAAEQGWTLELETERGGISFPNFHPDPSSIPVLDGLGPVGGGMHTREEWVSLPSLDRRIDLLARLLAEASD